MMRNLILQEAIEQVQTISIEEIVASIKKMMNLAKLTKFKSEGACAQFYSAFFLSTLPDDVPTVEQWSSIYTNLLSEPKFIDDLASYMVLYRPAVFSGLFAPLWAEIQSELTQMKQNQVRYLSLVKAQMTMLQTRMNAVGQIARSQVSDTESLKFISITDQVLQQMIFDLDKLMNQEIAKTIKPDSIAVSNRYDRYKMSEDAIELVSLFENADEWFQKTINENSIPDPEPSEMDEGIIKNAVMKTKSVLVAAKKAQKDFEDIVMRKVKKIRENRRNRKHSEMVGEALAINHEIKRLLKSGGWFIINPALGVLRFIISIVYDRSTDKKDRMILIQQIKDEIEIVEEKIAMAERNGDDKARIELIRARQKMVREYQRINAIRYDDYTRQRLKDNNS